MRDNHTFIPLKGDTLDDIKEEAIRVAKENPYGMVCPVTVIEDGNEVNRIGTIAHVDGQGNVNLDEWYEAVKSKLIYVARW